MIKNKIIPILILLIGISFAQKPTSRTPESTDFVRLLDSDGYGWDQTLTQILTAGIGFGASSADTITVIKLKVSDGTDTYSLRTVSDTLGIYGDDNARLAYVDSLGNWWALKDFTAGEDLIAVGDVSVGDDVLLADGAVIGITGNEVMTFNAAGTIAISGANLTTAGNIQSSLNIGAVEADSTEVVAVEYGDGYNHVTILTLTNVNLGTPTESSNEAVGDTIYVFPAGAQLIEAVDLYIALTADSVTTDTPEIGLGSVVGTGAQATLGAAGATMEDYWEGTAVDSCGGTAQALGIKGATAGYGTGIALNNSSDVKNLCLNAADGWAAGVVGNLLATGTVAIKWTTLR